MDTIKHCEVAAEEGEVLMECGGAVASLSPEAARSTGDLLHEHADKAARQANQATADDRK